MKKSLAILMLLICYHCHAQRDLLNLPLFDIVSCSAPSTRISWGNHNLELSDYCGQPVNKLFETIGQPSFMVGTIESNDGTSGSLMREIIAKMQDMDSTVLHLPMKSYEWHGKKNVLRTYCIYRKDFYRAQNNGFLFTTPAREMADWLTDCAGDNDMIILFFDVVQKINSRDRYYCVINYIEWKKYHSDTTMSLQDYYYNNRILSIWGFFSEAKTLNDLIGIERDTVLDKSNRRPKSTQIMEKFDAAADDVSYLCKEDIDSKTILIDCYNIPGWEEEVYVYYAKDGNGVWRLVFFESKVDYKSIVIE